MPSMREIGNSQQFSSILNLFDKSCVCLIKPLQQNFSLTVTHQDCIKCYFYVDFYKVLTYWHAKIKAMSHLKILSNGIQGPIITSENISDPVPCTSHWVLTFCLYLSDKHTHSIAKISVSLSRKKKISPQHPVVHIIPNRGESLWGNFWILILLPRRFLNLSKTKKHYPQKHQREV